MVTHNEFHNDNLFFDFNNDISYSHLFFSFDDERMKMNIYVSL